MHVDDFNARVPLEIGTTSAAKTMYQIINGGSLARWPYGSKRVFIFYAPEPL